MGIRSLAAELLPTALQGLQRAVSMPAAKSPKVASFAALTERLSYLSKAENKKVLEAFKFADEAHLGQFRASGEPYITHPIAVAGLCAEWKLDVQAIMAALMHDTIEDQGVTKAELIERFGAPTADLVDGLTKLDKLQFNTREEGQAESFRKMLLAMARDVRVILIKLADRLHNMRTMQAMQPDKRQRIARETLDIYAPIAHRLGLNQVYRELQELSFEYLYPWRHAALSKAVQRARGNRRDIVERVRRDVEKAFAAAKIKVRVSGREKTVYSIYRKIARSTPASPTSATCSASTSSSPRSRVLSGAGRAAPAVQAGARALQGLHRHPQGQRLPVAAHHAGQPAGHGGRVQMRTEAMHAVAETGVAAHWLYKVNDKSDPATDPQRLGAMWLQSLIGIRTRRATRPSSWSTSRSTCSPTRSTCSRRAARSWRCRAAPRRWTSPTRSTPMSATTRSLPRSTARPSRCAPSCTAATWWRSSPPPAHGPIRRG